MVKERDSSFELLRLFLMVLIIIHHCIAHGLGLASLSTKFPIPNQIPENQMGLAFGINSLCICAVNCFILISGYFKITVTKKKFFDLLFTILFYTLLLTVIPYSIRGQWNIAIEKSLFLSHSQYWFAVDYLFLMVIAPLLNCAYNNLDKHYTRPITIGLIVICCYFGFFWSHPVNVNGYSLFQFITMYCIGREIRINNFKMTVIKGILLYFLASIACAVIGWLLWLRNYDILAWQTTYYNNPLLILSSIGLFMVFKGLKFQSKLVNRLAKSAFGIYLFQSSASVSFILYSYIRFYISYWNTIEIYLMIFLIAVLVSIISIIFDQIRIVFQNFSTILLRFILHKDSSK